MTYIKLRDIAKKNGIAITYSHAKKVKGWVNQPKGILQVLYERGFIDEKISEKDYTEKGIRIGTNVYDENFKYHDILQNLQDFREEMSSLEYYGSKIGIKIKLSPKYHPEIAGEGIEYIWGLSKCNFRKQPLNEKKKRNNFLKLVDK